MTAAVGLAVAMMPLTARAGTVSETVYDPSSNTYTATTFGITGGVPGTSAGTPTNPISFNGFNAVYDGIYGAGTHTGVVLDSVQITIQESAQVSGSITNNNTTPTTGDTTGTVGVDNYGSFALSGGLSAAMSQLNVEDHHNFSFSVAAGATHNTGTLTTTAVTSTAAPITSAGYLSSFANAFGGVNGDLGFSSTGCGNGNCTGTSTDAGQIGVSVQYTFSNAPPMTVPEPASLILLGSGLLGIGMVRFKRT